MQKIGTIIKLPNKQKNGLQIVTVAFDTPEAELCSIKSTDSAVSCGCGCTGGCCAGCGSKQAESGLFAVKGNIVNALNTTGTELRIGKKVQVFISEKAAFLQGISSVGVPLVLAALCFTLVFLKTGSEALALGGLAGGFAVGVCTAFLVARFAKERALPHITAIYEAAV